MEFQQMLAQMKANRRLRMRRKTWRNDAIGIEGGVLTFYKKGEPLMPYMPTNEELMESDDWKVVE